MQDLKQANEELVKLLDEAIDIASDTILTNGIFIQQRFSRLKRRVSEFKRRQQAGNNMVKPDWSIWGAIYAGLTSQYEAFYPSARGGYFH